MNNINTSRFLRFPLSRYNAVLAVALLLITCSSCKKALLEEPKSLSVGTFYNTAAEVEAAANAIYLPYHGGSNNYAEYFMLLESYSDYCVGRNTYITNYSGMSATNTNRAGGTWTMFYLSIRNANLVIANAPNGKNISQADINKFVGEAKFMRAFNYFQLVKNWGGVPLHTEKNIIVTDVKRSTAAEVYELIISDLLDAEKNLPDVAAVSGRPSKWSAKTLLTDVYLQTGNFAGARDKAGEVISSNKYSLVPISTTDDFQKIYGPDVITTPEEVFYMKYTRQTGLGNYYVMFVNHPANKFHGAGGFFILYTLSTTSYFKNWDNNDKRKGLWYEINLGLGPNTMQNKKFIDPLGPSSTGAGNDHPWYRYADVLMMYAEATSRLGGPTPAAMQALNQVHRRAYGYNPLVPSPIDFNMADYNASNFLDLVIKEYGYEFQIEGKRWTQLVRTGKAPAVILAEKGQNITQKHYLWPIPVSELNFNKALDPIKDQNPGY